MTCDHRLYNIPERTRFRMCGEPQGHRGPHIYATNAMYCGKCGCSMERSAALDGHFECMNFECINGIDPMNQDVEGAKKQMTAIEVELNRRSKIPKIPQDNYFNEFGKVLSEMMDLTKRKNSDYAESSDAYANFRVIEEITNGRITLEAGILVRMTDKLKRIASLIARPPKVIDEKITDTIFDMAVYSVILLIYMRHKNVDENNAQNITEKRDS